MIKHNLFILILLFPSLNIIHAQSLTSPVGAASVASGNTSLTRKEFWSVFNNQAAMAWNQQAGAGIFAENRFLIPDMNRIAAGIILPIKRVVLGFTADQSGGQAYAETKAGLSAALKLGNHISAGLQLDYFHMKIPEGYNNHYLITFEGGLYADITEQINFGIHIFNPLRSKWNQTEERMPACIRGGISYQAEPSLSIYLEANKSTALPVILSAGAEYRYKQVFILRAGITNGLSKYCFGIGVVRKNLRIDLASSVHSWLGFSPHVSITYQFKP